MKRGEQPINAFSGSGKGHLEHVQQKAGYGSEACPLSPWCFCGDSDGTESAGSAGDPGLIPGLGRSLGDRISY